MSTHFNDIVAALENHLIFFTDLESVPVAWPAKDFIPTDSEYVRCTFLPGDTRQATIGDNGYDAITGLFQIDTFTPKGAARSTLPDDLADHFKRGTILNENDVRLRLRTTSIERPTHGDAWTITPISITWDTFLEAR